MDMPVLPLVGGFMAMELVKAAIRDFRGKIHHAENLRILEIDKARAGMGMGLGKGLAYAQRPTKDWRGILAMRIGGLATPGGRYLNATTHVG